MGAKEVSMGMFGYDAEEKKRDDIRVVSSGSSRWGTGYNVEVGGMTEREHLVFQGAMNGYQWVRRGPDGRLEHSLAYNELPKATDPDMLPFWRPVDTSREPVQQVLDWRIVYPQEREPYSPHIMIGHLCGYYYTPEKYRKEADKLESYGFECMRSRRGIDGRYAEMWYLSGLWAAKGELATFIAPFKEDPEKLDKAVSFLCTNCSFGTLDVTYQRAAMGPPGD